MNEQREANQVSCLARFAIFVRLPVGITSLKQDGESLPQQPFVEQFLV
jgi:hypothetical protein